jgi:CRP-like cAMP-binding protein
MPQTITPLIRKLEREAPLSDAERQVLLLLPVTVREFRADSDIVHERDTPSQCCLLLQGWLHRYKIAGDGSRQIFAFHIAGDVPDLQSLHLRRMDHSLGASTPVKVGFIPHDSIRRLIERAPRLGGILWKDTLIDASIFRQWMLGMGRKQAPQRLAHFFCELYTKMQAVGLTDGFSCDFPITQGAMGDALGLSTVHVNRSLMELRADGLIELEKKTLTICNWERLKQYAEFDRLYLHMDLAA